MAYRLFNKELLLIVLCSQMLTSLLAQPTLFKEIALNSPCSSMDIDNEGNVFLLDKENNRIHKYFQQMGFDSVLTMGGKRNSEEGFIQPIKLSIKNRQNLYVLDDAGRKVVLLNTNLRVVQSFDFWDMEVNAEALLGGEELLPLSFDVSMNGEQFVLNQFDNRVYKVNSFGELELAFGGLDYGEGSLYEPVDIYVNEDNLVFISDFANEAILVFDIFGTYRYEIDFPKGIETLEFSSIGKYLIAGSNNRVFLYHLQKGEWEDLLLELPSDLVDVRLDRDFLYLLFKNALHLYTY